MPTAHFSPDLFRFLRELKAHNEREWFQAHKARYEEHVRGPYLRFISDLAPRLGAVGKSILADPRPVGGSLFRIYRDTRFAKDKSPYKTYAGAHFAHRRAKEGVHAPGLYLHLSPGECFGGGGIWHPDAPTLAKVRGALASKPEAWKKARRGLTIEGESLSRPPRGYDPDHPLIEDLKRKDFVTSVRFSEAEVCRPDFLAKYVASCRRMSPLLEFLTKALGLKW